MQIIVSDTTCIIDLKLGAVLAPLFRLPYQFIIPMALFESELLSFSDDEKRQLRTLGLESRELDSHQMEIAQHHFQAVKPLSARDCYALALAETIDSAILLTGDRNLRTRAESLSVRIHGVIWAVDQLIEHNCCSEKEALFALSEWLENPDVFLPEEELQKRINLFR